LLFLLLFFVCSRFTRSIALKLHLVFSSLSIKNVGEDAETINDYKESVKKLLGLQAWCSWCSNNPSRNTNLKYQKMNSNKSTNQKWEKRWMSVLLVDTTKNNFFHFLSHRQRANTKKEVIKR
jgi:hypothetical protein